MLNSRYFFLLPLSLFLAASLGLVAGGETAKPFLFFVLFFPLFASSLLSQLVFRQKRRFGYFYYVLCCFSLFLLMVMSWFRPVELPAFIPPLALSWPFIASIFLIFISLLVAIPLALIPYLKGVYKKHVVASESAAGDEFNVDFVNLRFDNIKQKFEAVESAVRSETSEINRAIGEFQRSIQSQQAEARRRQKDIEKLREELERYKELYGLTKKQQAAIIAALGKQKYFDYMVGFVLGIVGSVLVQWVPELVLRFTGGPHR